jgi:hypothetical protein
VTWKAYHLGPYASASRGYHQGKIYRFEVSKRRCYLDWKAK